MEFNPLDLLASAAELQQKHDDGPETTMTRSQHKNNTTPAARQTSTGTQKENKITNNNNNSLKTKETGVLRKMKFSVNPDLEKMLNEHNYGNAKKTLKYERDIEYIDEKLTNGESERLNSIEETDNHAEGVEDSACDRDESVVVLNGVQDSDESGTQGRDREEGCGCGTEEGEGGGVAGEAMGTDSCTCDHVTAAGGATDSAVTCTKCNDIKCECPRVTVDTQQTVDSSGGSSCDGNNCESSVLKTHDGKQTETDCSCGHGNTEIVDRVSQRCHCKALEEDLKTLSELNSDSCSGEVNCKIDVNKGEDNHSESVDKKVESQKRIVTCRVLKGESAVKRLVESSTSPQQGVSSLKDISFQKDKQTLVINITKRKPDPNTNNAVVLNSSDIDSDKNKIGIIRTLLTAAGNKDVDRVQVKALVSPKRPKLELPESASGGLEEQSDTCHPFKSFELDTTMCTDSSPSNVHLLSPDRRNPDSMGVVESPVTHPLQDIPGFDEQDMETVKGDPVDLESNDSSSQDCSNLDTNSSVKDISPKGEINTRQTESFPSSSVSDKKSEESANNATASSSGSNHAPVFRFDTDHCYAGLPEKINGSNKLSVDQEASVHSESEEASTPLGSTTGDLSQDSGYEDISQSPDLTEAAPANCEDPLPIVSDQNSKTEKQTVSNIVPVFLNMDSDGCLTINKASLPPNLTGQVFALSESPASGTDSGLKLISGTNLSTITQNSIVLSPIAKPVPQVSLQAPNLTSVETVSLAVAPDVNTDIKQIQSPQTAGSTQQEISPPPKYGKFKIGTFASFSNTGMGPEEKVKFNVMNTINPPANAKSSLGRTKIINKTPPPASDYLGTLVQKVKSSLSPPILPQLPDTKNLDHIQHDHDYCMKNLMPSVVSSVLESKLLKDNLKMKATHPKSKKQEVEKVEGKGVKRKRGSPYLTKAESVEELEVDEDSDSYLTSVVRPKTRAERYIEQKSVEPKVKITGSSNFQDQFVYFMNTKKRSRRRESRDSPNVLPVNNQGFIPPKPGDIIVPHLTDQDIENLKLRSKQSQSKSSGVSGYNSLRNEFMAAKLSNVVFSSQPQVDPSPSTTVPASTAAAADEEKSIINTILSMENENLLSYPVVSVVNESMEMYGQGLGGDIMNLLPEQMNLTQEQMDILFSAVDEVQNSSPGLIGAEKLVESSTSEEVPTASSSFGQFPLPTSSFDDASPVSESGATDLKKDNVQQSRAVEKADTPDKPGDVGSPVAGSTPEVAETLSSAAETQISVGETKTPTSESQPTEAGPQPPTVETQLPVADAQPSSVESHLPVADAQPPAVESQLPVADAQLPTNEMQLPDAQLLAVEKPLPVADAQPSAIESDSQTPAVETQLPVGGSQLTVSETKTAAVDSLLPEVKEGVAIPPATESCSPVESSLAPEAPGLVPVEPDLTVIPEDAEKTNVNCSLPLTTEPGAILGSNDAPTTDSVPIQSAMAVPESQGLSAVDDLQSAQPLVVGGSSSISALPTPLDILSNDFKLDKTDFFPENAVSTTTQVQTPVSASTSSAPMDYNAPWIVTVSMYWNDLPAVMMNNHPYVRLVDIHKQILPAKDTGILKKRCQLMGIEVENCSEMQRYFLVQYGKAFNSKSTLIISIDDAKVLIGYYVDPQPKSVKPYDHKSIIDHRREQLRRIALARRAAMKAQRSAGKAEEDDPRLIKEPPSQEINSVSEFSVTKSETTTLPPPITPAVASSHRQQRATRHKKINFLELLRGDSGTTQEDAEPGEEEGTKRLAKSSDDPPPRKRQKSLDKKYKVVKYTVETDSSDESTESNESDMSSSDDSTTDSCSEVVVITKPAKKKLNSGYMKTKPKSKIINFKGQGKLPPLKIKTSAFTNRKRTKQGLSKSAILSSGEMISKSVGTPVVNNETSKSGEFESSWKKQSPAQMDFAQSYNQGHAISLSDNKSTAPGAVVRNHNSVPLEEVVCRNHSEDYESEMWSSRDVCLPNTQLMFPYCTTESVEKVGNAPPEDILDTCKTKEMETNTDFDLQSNEGVDRGDSNATNIQGVSDCAEDSVDGIQEDSNVKSTYVSIPGAVSGTSEVLASPSEGSLQSPEGEVAAVMKRKEVYKVNSNETPVRVVHRDSSDPPRYRPQLGELFVDRYHNKKSLCIRCYTCRKMMSVDNFSRHLHDVVSGGLIKMVEPHAIFPSDSDLNETESKYWENFLRKRELFENNQLPSPDMNTNGLFCIDTDVPPQETVSDVDAKPSGPRVINTPVSPVKKQKKVNSNGTVNPRKANVKRKAVTPVFDSVEGVRSSSRKRKKKQLYPFEEYSFAKFPRLQHGSVDSSTSNTEHRNG